MVMIRSTKAILFIFTVLLILSRPMALSAAVVEWGMSAVVTEQAGYGDADWLFTIGKPYFNIAADIIGSTLVLSALPDSNLVNANTFAKAVKGDVVSREYMSAKEEYFAWAEYGNPSVHTDYKIILDGSKNIYLAFVADYSSYETARYGWLELGLDERGLLKVYSSAWDLDGDAVAVGAIPEPSSGVLLVLGVAVMALARKSQMHVPLRYEKPAT